MSTLGEFFNMGGHGVYVWSSYVIVLVVLAGNALLPVFHDRKLRSEIRAEIGSKGMHP